MDTRSDCHIDRANSRAGAICSHSPSYSLKHLSGVKLYLNSPQRKHLVEWVTANKRNRRAAWDKIPRLLELDYGRKAIQTAFKKEGYVRRIARKKPPLTYDNQLQRLQ